MELTIEMLPGATAAVTEEVEEVSSVANAYCRLCSR